MKPIHTLVVISLSGIQALVGLGAVVSGVMLVLVPTGALLHFPPDMLKGTPFRDFLIPGIILFLVVGVGQFIAAFLTIWRNSSAGIVGAVFGIGLMIWIFVQVNMIGGGHILQYGYFALGVIETALSVLIHGRRAMIGAGEAHHDGG